MAIQFSDHYPISPEQLFQLFAELDFFKQRFADTGIKDYEVVQFEAVETGFAMVFELNTPIQIPEGIPRAARKLLPEYQKMHYSMHWQRQGNGWLANYCYDIHGRPIKVLGSRLLTATDQGCSSEVDFHVDANIPMFGKVLAEILEKRIRLELEADELALKQLIGKLAK